MQFMWVDNWKQLKKLVLWSYLLYSHLLSSRHLPVTLRSCLIRNLPYLNSEHLCFLGCAYLFQLRQLRVIFRSLSLNAALTLARVFVCSRIQYTAMPSMVLSWGALHSFSACFVQLL